MSNKVIFKRSSVVGRVPSPETLDYGEVALNFADGRLYYKDSNNEVQFFASYEATTGLGAVLDNKEYIVSSDGTHTYNVTYEVGYVEVHVNGVKLPSTDYTATNGISVTIPGLFANDEVSLFGYRLFNPTNTTVYNRETYVATAGQTTFAIQYVRSGTKSYVEVYVNGILLKDSEYTATDGTSIVLSTAAELDDVVECIGYSDFTFTDLNLYSIDSFGDVDITTTAPTANQALVWDAVNSKFVPGDSFSQADFDSAFTAKSTSDLSEGTNLYYTDARARASISVTDAGGDGSLAYDSATGILTYTGPSATEVRAHFSGGTGVDITDGVVSIGQPVATTDSVEFADLTIGSANLIYNDGYLEYNAGGGTVPIKVGATQLVKVYNATGSTLSKGQIVRSAGSQGNLVAVQLAIANAESTSAGSLGMVAHSIAAGGEGYVIVGGIISGLDTSLLSGGAIYLSDTTAGAFTQTKPTAPNHLVVLGVVERISASVGSIYIKVDNGYELNELHDVYYTTPNNNDLLKWVAAESRWEVGTLSTTEVSEGDNLYYTDARVQTKLGSVSGNIIPDTTNVYDIGSATNVFKTLHTSIIDTNILDTNILGANGVRWYYDTTTGSTRSYFQYNPGNQRVQFLDGDDTISGIYLNNNQLWHAGNDGASSGLDADLLDGQEGSYYLDWGNVTNKPDPVVTVTLTGDVTGSADTILTDLASGTISIATTIAADSVELGTDTTGNYMVDVTAGTGVSISHTPGEGSTATISIGQDVSTTSNVTFDTVTTNGNLTIGGNLTVNGTTTTVNATELAITDNLIYLNEGSTITNPDLGWVGNYNDGTYAHTGIFRDASDTGKFKFFKGYTPEPGQGIDTTDASFALADVVAENFYGALIGNATTSTTATVATNVTVTNTGTFGTYYVPFLNSNTSGDKGIFVDTNGPSYNPSLNILSSPIVSATSYFLGIDNIYLGLGSSIDAKLFYDGVNNTMELELEADAQSFIITDNGTTRFTFDKTTGSLGIGKSPSYKLNVLGTEYSGVFETASSTDGDAIRISLVSPVSQGQFEFDWFNNSSRTGGGYAMIQTGKTTNSPDLAIMAGNVGIGTSTPNEKLVVAGGNIHVGNVTASTPITSGEQYQIKMGQQYWSGTKGTDGSIKLELYSTGAGDTYGLGVSNSELEIQSQADIGLYAGGSSTRTKRVHIESSNGNVGIGIDSPSSRLHTVVSGRSTAFSAGDGTTWHDLIIQNPNSTQNAAVGLAFELNSTYHANAGTGIAAVKSVSSTDYAADLVFINRPNAASAIETMRIMHNGNIGIGTTGPNESLHIYRATGDASFRLQNASQQLRIDQNSIRTTTNSDISIFTNGNSAQLYLDQSAGSVGINTNTPGAALEVNRGSAPFAAIFGASGGAGKVLLFKDNAATPTKYNYLIGSQYNIDNGFEITPSTAVGGTTFSTPALVVLSNGNVGINKNAPGTDLDIAGVARVSNGSSTHFLYMEQRDSYANDTESAHMWISTGSSAAGVPFPGEGAHWVFEGRQADRSMVFRTNGVNRLNIAGTGPVTAYTDIRSPIYYDYTDTNYYVNPNGASNIGSYTSNSDSNLQTASADSVYHKINNASATGTYSYLQLTTTTGNGYLIRNRATGNSVNDKSLYLWNDPGPIEFVPNGNISLRTTIDTSGNINVPAAIIRKSAGTGYLSGGYGSAESTATTGAIYTIGGSYVPTSSSLNNMYGIGFTYANVAGGAGAYTVGTAWGLYVASNGNTRVFLDSDYGRVIATGDMRAPIYYDTDTTYYVDPNSQSRVKKIWIDNGGAAGVGWSTGLNMGDGSSYWNMIQDAGIARSRNFGSGGFEWWSNGASLILDLDNSGNLTVTGTLSATSKSFLIDHPTKPGMKLRYGSLEGPENGVYIRGKIKGNVIELPEYWTKLVDPDSITVQLTPIGKHQKLFVEDIRDNKVFISSEGFFASEINCFYYIQAERVDIDKLEVESFE